MRTPTSLTGSRTVAAASLRSIAHDLDAAARRVTGVLEVENRRREATQVRFIATCVSTGRFDALAGPWINAARRLLAAYEEKDRLTATTPDRSAIGRQAEPDTEIEHQRGRA